MAADLPLGMLPSAADHYGKSFVAKVNKISKWPLAQILQRVVRDDGLDENTAKACQTEFLQYISLALLTRQKLLAPRYADIFWHQFLVDTKAYLKFCDGIFGHFVHHLPGKGGEARDATNAASAKRTVKLFSEVFGITLGVSPAPHPTPGGLRSHAVECDCGHEGDE